MRRRAAVVAALRGYFDAQGVCWGKYQSMSDLIDHDPDCSPANPIYHLVEQPDIGTYPVAGQAMHFGGVTREAARRAPRLGEHTDEVLKQVLGYDESKVAALRTAGAFSLPPKKAS